jgi:hypothetical protein
MKTNFGGIGTEILMFKTQFEIEADHVDSLMKQIGEQNAVVASAYADLSKIFAGDLEKIAGGDLTKKLVACKSLLGTATAEIDKLKKLMAECERAQGRAQLAMPNFAMYATNGREDTVPSRKYFMADKDATVGAFKISSAGGIAPGSHPRRHDACTSVFFKAMTERNTKENRK